MCTDKYRSDVVASVLRFYQILKTARLDAPTCRGVDLFHSERIYKLAPEESEAWKGILPIESILKKGSFSHTLAVVRGRGETPVSLFHGNNQMKTLGGYHFTEDYTVMAHAEAHIGVMAGQVYNAFVSIHLGAKDAYGRWIVSPRHNADDLAYEQVDFGDVNIWLKVSIQEGQPNSYSFTTFQNGNTMQRLAINDEIAFAINCPIDRGNPKAQIFSGSSRVS